MLVNNKTAFNTSIYSAIVVNTSTLDDPENQGRIQIYIPSVQYMDANIYGEYMSSTNKKTDPNFKLFPWAVTLVTGLNVGDIVYGGYIDNDSSKYIILGKDNSSNITGAYSADILNTSALLDLAMPIIIRNEVGCSINDWLNNSIADNYYTKISLHDGDNNSWSIGLIQWNGGRAYSTLYECVKGCGENWEEGFNKTNGLYIALKLSLALGSPNAQSPGFSKNYNPDVGSSTYNAIKRILGFAKSKEIQKTATIKDTADTIDMLKEKGITNPAILIYLADLINQYGAGIPETIDMAITVCNNDNLNIIQQLDYLIDNKIKTYGDYYTYVSRRNRTYDYVKSLYDNGKFTANVLTDLTGNTYTNSNVVVGHGQYSMPFQGVYQVTATFGKYGDRYKPGYIGKDWGGYHNSPNKFHSGVDFGLPTGTPLYACTEGTVLFGTSTDSSGNFVGAGRYAYIKADDGNYIWYMHMKSWNGTSGRRVNKGDLIGYSDNTGNSSGPHLHFEIRVGNNSSSSAVNPFPYIGYEGNDRYYEKYIGS